MKPRCHLGRKEKAGGSGAVGSAGSSGNKRLQRSLSEPERGLARDAASEKPHSPFLFYPFPTRVPQEWRPGITVGHSQGLHREPRVCRPECGRPPNRCLFLGADSGG